MTLNRIAFHFLLATIGLFLADGHGFGLRKANHTAVVWPRLLASWLRSQKLIEKKSTE